MSTPSTALRDTAPARATSTGTPRKGEAKARREEAMGGGFVIRPATRGDMSHVVRFIRSSADWYREIVDEKDMAEHDVDETWAEKNFTRREFYLGYDGRLPIGTLSIQDFGDYLYLGYVYLDVKHVGRGHGRRLLRYAVKEARRRGKKGMVLIAHPDATWAVKAYEKFGFRCIARDRGEVLDWNGGALDGYYEEGFHLFRYEV